jgi:hypothetical protein
MANKNLIIGGFTNYGINQLKPWVLSAKEVAGDNEVVLVTGNTTDETVDWLRDQGVVIVPMLQVNNVPIHVLRFLSIYDYLHKYWQEYNYVVTTDVKDVYFQADPFKIFDNKYYQDNNFKLVVASEGLKYKDEAWGNENLMQAYGPYVYEQFKDNEIFNVGTFGGVSEYVKDMVFNIFTNAINRPIPICDQAVFNVLINTQPFKDIAFYTHDWACELGTVMDPSKIEGFRPNLLFSEPIWKDGEVRVPPMGATLFPIVHQYDRVPELKKFVQEKYGQEDDSQVFVYRTT